VEEHLILVATDDAGGPLDEAAAARLLSLPGRATALSADPAVPTAPQALEVLVRERRDTVGRSITERNGRFLEAEAEKLEGWADDQKLSLEREIKDLDRQIREARKAASAALTLEDKLAGQKRIKAIESQRKEKRRSLFDAQDEVDRQRDELISRVEANLTQRAELIPLFRVRWSLS